MKLNQTLCDGCEKPIDPKAGYLNLNVLRGGFILAVANADGASSTKITHDLNLCGPQCLPPYIAKTHVKTISTTTNPEAPKTTVTT